MKFVELIVQAVKSIADLCNKLMDAADGEKYAAGVQALNQNVDETYNQMRELILNDETLSTETKLEKLEKLAKSQEAARKNCEAAIEGNKKQVAKIGKEIFAALATCGLSYLPQIVNAMKSNNPNEPASIPEAEQPALIEDTSEPLA